MKDARKKLQAAYWYCFNWSDGSELLEVIPYKPKPLEKKPNDSNQYANNLGYKAPEVAILIIESWIKELEPGDIGVDYLMGKAKESADRLGL